MKKVKTFQNLITADKDILGGKPVIKGTRVPVALIVEEMAGGMQVDHVMQEYELNREQVLSALHYAAAAVKEEVVFN